MSRAHIAVLAASGLAVAAFSTPGAPAQQLTEPLPRAKSVRAPYCSLPGAKTMKANRHVRVFQAQSIVYGCRRDANRAYRIGYFGECQNNDEARIVEVAGNRAALGIFECSLTSGWWRIDLVNLRDGRREFTSGPLTTPPTADNVADTIHRIAVTADGAVAWSASRRIAPQPAASAVEIRRRQRGTRNRALLLDSGTDIDPDSLRRRGDTIAWTKAGVRRSARL
jgi:hypothetical protein